jgi:hypothetical protein
MPGTDDDARLIANMPPGTRVRRINGDEGVVTTMKVKADQIPVYLVDTFTVAYCYPVNLEIIVDWVHQYKVTCSAEDSFQRSFLDGVEVSDDAHLHRLVGLGELDCNIQYHFFTSEGFK